MEMFLVFIFDLRGLQSFCPFILCDDSHRAQENVVTLVGLVVGGYLANWLHTHSLAVWSIFVVLTLIHVYANYLAVLTLKLRTLNSNRIALLTKWWVENKDVPTGRLRRYRRTNAARFTTSSELLCQQLESISGNKPRFSDGARCRIRSAFMKIARGSRLHFLAGYCTTGKPTADAINENEPILPGWIWGIRAALFIPTNVAVYGTLGASLEEAMTQCSYSCQNVASGFKAAEREYMLVLCQYSQNTFWVACLLGESYGRNDILFPVLHVRQNKAS